MLGRESPRQRESNNAGRGRRRDFLGIGDLVTSPKWLLSWELTNKKHSPLWSAGGREDWGFPDGTSSKEPACQCRRCKRCRLIPGSGRYPGGECGNPLQYSCLENPMDMGAWQATVHGVTKSRTRLKRLSTGGQSASQTVKCDDKHLWSGEKVGSTWEINRRQPAGVHWADGQTSSEPTASMWSLVGLGNKDAL